MVRLTDLLKKINKQIGPKEEQPKKPFLSPEESTTEKLTKPKLPEEEKLTKKVDQLAFSEMLLQEEKKSLLEEKGIEANLMATSLPNEEETKKLYFEALRVIRKQFYSYRDQGVINWEVVKGIANKITNNIISGSPVLLDLFHRLDSLRLYLYHNAINTSILAVAIGMVYKYNKSILLDLATAGLLHDIDFIRIKDIIYKPKELNEAEIKEIRKHPENLADFLKKLTNFENGIFKAVLQHHERKDGQGYPVGLTEKNIHELAFIIGIADTYEALTHSRPYKTKMNSHSAISKLIEIGNDLFPNNLIKKLVSTVGLYPIGSWVELNTGEICKVLKSNTNFPLRPIVVILLDKERNKLEEMRTIDLCAMPSLHITRYIENIENYR